MRSWVLKAAAIAVLSRIPQGDRLAAVARKYVTKSLTLPDHVAIAKCERAARHVQYFLEVNALMALPDDFVALELGTGWFPAAPVAVSMLGAARTYTVDVSSHLEWPQMQRTLEVVRGFAHAHAFPGVRTDRLPLLDEALASRDVARALEILGIERVIGDARTLTLARPVDCYFSNNTLEHIPEDDLRTILRRFHEIGSRRAVMSHWIDMSDHYMGVEPEIGPFNYLRFSSSAFRHINGPIHYQNRLRHSDFQRIHADAGWHVALDEPTVGKLSDLRKVPVAPEFRRYTEQDLLVYEAWMVSAKEPVASGKLSPSFVHDVDPPRSTRESAIFSS